MQFTIEYDNHGRFRIVAGVAGNRKEGDWSTYTGIATLTLGTGPTAKTYIASSEYGLLPKAETVYEITAQSSELKETGTCIHKEPCRVCRELAKEAKTA
jgi:hypothetical protein